MKIQCLSLNFEPEEIGIAVYSTGFAREMAKRGHIISAFCAHPHYPQWRRRSGWPRFGYHTLKTDDAKFKVVHCPLYVPKKPTAKSRILHYATFAISALPRLIGDALKSRPDIVFVVAPSLVSAVSGLITAKMTGAKLWLHIQDYEVEAAFATGAISPDSRLGRIALTFETWILRKFDMISSISIPMLDKLREKGFPEEKIYEFRNWANLQEVQVIEGLSPMRKELDITTKYVAYYSGNVAAKQGLEIIPEAARILTDRDDLTFVICGEGPFLDTLKEKAAGLKNIRFYPLQPFEKLSDALGIADVHLLPQIAEVAELVLPSKLTNMLASGRPVVATAYTGTALAQEVEGAGIVTEPGNTQAFAQAIANLLDNPKQREELGQKARQKALGNWDMTAILDKLEIEMTRLADKSETNTPNNKS
jgi:colanic acid biosynthesis glycosyl transferase WcaI